MAQEIVYTSARQGLRPGAYGFCTVAATAGMPASLLERLESLSGYRHVYEPGHAANPVVVSHLVLRAGGREQHVLSRIADSGLDYSHRSNKLAHHVVLDAHELPPAGPAWLASAPGWFTTTFSGEPASLPARSVPQAQSEPRVCTAWQQAAGDAGWAGVLAQQALEGRRPAYVIVPAGIDPLPLVAEALALVPSRKRWDVSFSTCFSKLPAGIDCLWRFVLAGTSEAQQALALRGDLVLDLTRPLGTAPTSPLVEAARTGHLAVMEPEPPTPSPMIPGAASAPVRMASTATSAAVQDDYTLKPSLPPSLRPTPPKGPPRLRRTTESNSPTGRPWRSIVGLGGTLLMLVGAAVFGLYYEPIINWAAQSRHDPGPVAKNKLESPETILGAATTDHSEPIPPREESTEKVEDTVTKTQSDTPTADPNPSPQDTDTTATETQTEPVSPARPTPSPIVHPSIESALARIDPHSVWEVDVVTDPLPMPPKTTLSSHDPYPIFKSSKPESIYICGPARDEAYFYVEHSEAGWRVLEGHARALVATLQWDDMTSSIALRWLDDAKDSTYQRLTCCLLVVVDADETKGVLLSPPVTLGSITLPSDFSLIKHVNMDGPSLVRIDDVESTLPGALVGDAWHWKDSPFSVQITLSESNVALDLYFATEGGNARAASIFHNMLELRNNIAQADLCRRRLDALEQLRDLNAIAVVTADVHQKKVECLSKLPKVVIKHLNDGDRAKVDAWKKNTEADLKKIRYIEDQKWLAELWNEKVPQVKFSVYRKISVGGRVYAAPTHVPVPATKFQLSPL